MRVHGSIPRLLPGAVLILALAFGNAHGQMIPIEDVRECSADVSFQGDTDQKFEYPPAPFAPFGSTVNVLVENPDPEGPGSCSADAAQFSQFFPSGISISGGTGGSWSVLPGSYAALSSASFTFRVDTCIEYQLDTTYDPGDLGTEGRIRLDVPRIDLAYAEPQPGTEHVEGRLPAGTYEVEGHSYIISSLEDTQGPVFSITWTCQPCATTLIWFPPEDQTVGCGATAVFTVQPASPHGPLTYQWRRNLVPLANGGRVSGADTPTLTIAGACHADSGYYDVVLSDGTIVEPSRLARLAVVTTTGIEAPAEDSPLAFSLLAAGPNPFTGATSFRYAATSPRRALVAVYNAAGARVRTLRDDVLSGTGVIAWDGAMDSGARASAGIYFLTVESGEIRERRKLVLLR